jgi:hypothetical protein
MPSPEEASSSYTSSIQHVAYKILRKQALKLLIN